MSSTQVIFKPAGVVALVAVIAAVVTASVIGIRGKATSKVAGAGAPAQTAPTQKSQLIIDPSMTPGEIKDKELLASLNASESQARDWMFLGPIASGVAIDQVSSNASDEAKMRAIMATSYLPAEAKYQAKEGAAVTINNLKYHWRKVRGSGFDFKQMYVSPKVAFSDLNNVVVYGYTTVESKTAGKKQLRFRSDDGAVVWLNGKQIYFGDKIRGVEVEDVIPIDLRAGRNNVLVKVGQGSAGWGMSFQVEDLPGNG